jgi:hypothetical protein
MGIIMHSGTFLGAWAEATSRVEIGPLASCNSYRDPDLLADMARTVDHISDGRLILGLGAGFREREYREYGYEFGTPGSRVDELARSLPRIERRFSLLDPPPVRKIPVVAAVGRDPAEIERSVLVGGDPHTSDPELELGVTLFVVRNPGPSFDFGELRDWLAWRDERNAARSQKVEPQR